MREPGEEIGERARDGLIEILMPELKKGIERKKLIIKALKRGMPISEIARLSGVPRITIYQRLKNDKEYKHARNQYLTSIQNIFET